MSGGSRAPLWVDIRLPVGLKFTIWTEVHLGAGSKFRDQEGFSFWRGNVQREVGVELCFFFTHINLLFICYFVAIVVIIF